VSGARGRAWPLGALALSLALSLGLSAHAVETAQRTVPTGASGIDLHAFWDDRCQSCHGHAGDFARRTLAWRDDRLVGRHPDRNLSDFLRHHGVADDLVPPVLAMLSAQVQAVPRYEAACRGCHGTAASLARESLWLDGEVLRARRSGRTVAELLQGHGGLGPEDQAAMLTTLTRVRREVAP